MLTVVDEVRIADPVYMEKDFAVDDGFIELVRSALIDGKRQTVELGGNRHLNNCNKTVGGQLAVDIERLLNHEITEAEARGLPAVRQDDRGRVSSMPIACGFPPRVPPASRSAPSATMAWR
jgi:glutamate synthase (NADPH/NADH) large chain